MGRSEGVRVGGAEDSVKMGGEVVVRVGNFVLVVRVGGEVVVRVGNFVLVVRVGGVVVVVRVGGEEGEEVVIGEEVGVGGGEGVKEDKKKHLGGEEGGEVQQPYGALRNNNHNKCTHNSKQLNKYYT